jgi:hypothetical protein
MADDMQSLARKLIGPLWPWIADRIPIRTGTWTPTYEGSVTPGVTTYTLQQGAWTRFVNVMIVTGLVQWTAATGTGVAKISLPFATANVVNQQYSGSLWQSGVTFANSTPQINISPNAAFFLMTSPLTNAGNTTVAIEAAGLVVFTITYFV